MTTLPRIFVHMHKAAGASVVMGAQAQGLRFPTKHHLGNLIAPDGQQVRFEDMSHESFLALIDDLCTQGIQFFAMEWDCPNFEIMDPSFLTQCFTVIRSPWSRAISSFRWDLINGWVGEKVTSFRTYFNNSSYYCSDNYMVRKLCHIRGTTQVQPRDLLRAVQILNSFGKVIVLEKGSLAEELASLGLASSAKIHNELTAQPSLTQYNWRVDLNPSAEDEHWFYQHNIYDVMLYHRFLGYIPGAIKRTL